MTIDFKLFAVEYERIVKGNPHIVESVFRDRFTDVFRLLFHYLGLHRAASMFRMYRNIVTSVKKRGKGLEEIVS